MTKKIAVVVSRFNELVTKELLAGAVNELVAAGYDEDAISQTWVPGAFELPLAAAAAAKSGRFSAVICLGCVIRGETSHYDFVAGSAAQGVMQAGLDAGLPVIFGVLTTDTPEQALARCGLKGGNKGRDAARSALEMIKVLDEFGANK